MRVLLVEDEMFLSNIIAKKLSKENITVVAEYDGEKALDLIIQDEFDIVILDIMLPGMNGLDIVKILREAGNKIPIILTSAKGEVEDKVKGLEIGADDYLSKPYEFEELLARIKTNLRRVDDSYIIQNNKYGNLTMERNSLLIFTEDKEVKITLKEFELLEYLAASMPNTISKDQIIAKIWGYDADILPSHVEVYISYLRKKLKLIKANLEISTIRGVGYKLEVKNV